MIKGLLARAGQPQAGALVEERWSSSFGRFRHNRFAAEAADDYAARVRRGRLELEISKAGVFAWVTAPYKYRDFVLEGRISLDPHNGHSAAGFVFRQVNDENFYYFLLSNRGHFRLDVVFNRTPFHLIEWTPTELSPRGGCELRVLARGQRFAFFVDDEWIAEVTDDTIPEGAFGFGAQNYDERGQGRFYLHKVSVEARPVEVEKQYYRWVHVVPARPELRIALASSFLAMGKPVEALAQLRRALAQKTAAAEDYLLMGQAYLQARLYREAVASLDRCLSLEPGNTRAMLTRADALFLTHDYVASREYVGRILAERPELGQEPFLYNLLGSCEYNLGNWERSEASCRTAVGLDPGNPLYQENLARSLERLGRPEEALGLYLEAARLLFKAEIHDELSLVLARAQALASAEDTAVLLELKALEGKMLYQEGDRKGAEALFREVLDSGGQDSTAAYLYGLILIENKRRLEADAYLAKAAELEQSYPLYWFRLAENRYLQRGDHGAPDPLEALERALALSPGDPWINNLYGQVLSERGEPERALEYFRRALESLERALESLERPPGASERPGSTAGRASEGYAAPAAAAGQTAEPNPGPSGPTAGEAVDIYKNNVDVLLRLGRHREALELAVRALQACGEVAELLNLRGNAAVELRLFAAAREDYERALELDPGNPDYMGNLATCCLELDLILRSEELLNRLLEDHPSAWAYNLTGSLAMRKNEHERARLAFEEALKLQPAGREIRLNLVSLELDQGHYEQARELLAGVLAAGEAEARALELQARLRERFETCLSCHACGREWWVPREVPPQPGFSLRGEPPAEAPAGRCQACGRIYCIACAAAHVEEQRLMCPRCSEPLRIAEDPLKYLLLQCVESAAGAHGDGGGSRVSDQS